MKERKGNWTRSISRRVALLAKQPIPQLGMRPLVETLGVRCEHGGCYTLAKEEWHVPDVGHATWHECRRKGLDAPTRFIKTCGSHGPRNGAGREDARHTKQLAERRAQEQRSRNYHTLERLQKKLEGYGPVLPPGFNELWRDMTYAYIHAYRDTAMQVGRAHALNNALITYFASLSDAERTLLALVHPLPTKE